MALPSVPQIFKRPDALDSTLLFFWDPPTSDGGSAITSYFLSDGTNDYTIPGNPGFYRLTGLTNGQTYSFTLAASNAIGLGPSDSFRSVQPGVVPNPPTNPSYTSAGNLGYNVTWTNPANTSNASLLGTVLTAIPVDSNGDLVTTNSNNYIRRSVIGSGATSGFITLNTSNNWKVNIRTVNDPGYSSDTVYTSTITTVPVGGGSLSFNGSASTFLSLSNESDFRFGTSNFTVEWFQFQTSTASFPRIFSIGTYSSAAIAVSIEGGSFYLWVNGAGLLGLSVSVLNQWVHFAVTRSGNSLRVFRNGLQVGTTITNTDNINDTTNALTIGNETVKSAGAAFVGRITNFHWVKGTALYTSNFTPPTTPITPVANTKLLLLASTSNTVATDSSGLSKTVTNSNVTWSSNTPF